MTRSASDIYSSYLNGRFPAERERRVVRTRPDRKQLRENRGIHADNLIKVMSVRFFAKQGRKQVEDKCKCIGHSASGCGIQNDLDDGLMESRDRPGVCPPVRADANGEQGRPSADAILQKLRQQWPYSWYAIQLQEKCGLCSAEHPPRQRTALNGTIVNSAPGRQGIRQLWPDEFGEVAEVKLQALG